MYQVPGTSAQNNVEYMDLRTLGEGAFGKVYLCRKKGSRTNVVIKIFKDTIGWDICSSFNAEVAVLKNMHHKHIVTYIDSFVDTEGRPCIVMEYCQGGTLKEVIENRQTSGSSISERQILSIFKQLCQAVFYVHSNGVIHRDIKPDNILFSSDGDVKLGDFGVSKILESDARYTRTHAGTPCYMAPEIVEHKQHNNKCDMWSLGCVLYEMVTLKYAGMLYLLIVRDIIPGHSWKTWDHFGFPGNQVNIRRGCYDAVPSRVGIQLRGMITDLLSVDSRSRPSAAQILGYGCMQI